MTLLKRYLRSELTTLLDNNIRFNVIGRLDGLRPTSAPNCDDAARAHGRQHAACCSTSRSTTAAAPRSSMRRARAMAAGLSARRRSTKTRFARVPLHRRPARPRPAHPHERRDARQQLPAVADCLRRDLGDRHAVARLPPPAPARGDRWPTRSATAATAASRRAGRRRREVAASRA